MLLNLEARTGEDAIRELHAKLGRAAGAVTDREKFLADLVERAGIASVCIAPEIALPHARTAGVSRLVLAVGRSTDGVVFDAEHPGVRLVFLVGTPRDAVTDYLKLVAALSRQVRDPATREALISAATEGEFLSLLRPEVRARR